MQEYPHYFVAGDFRRELYDSLPNNEFLRLDALESLELPTTTVLFKTKPALPSVDLCESPLGKLPFGELSAITCAGLAVAYRLTAPRCTVRVGTNFAAISRRPSPSSEVSSYFVDRSIAVMGNSEALLALCPVLRWTTR